MTKDEVRDTWIKWLNAITERGRGLSAWEEEFVEDMRAKREREGNGFRLSIKQADVLERIYAEKTP